MKQEELDFVLEQNHYLKGGTKEACIKARDFLLYATKQEEQIHSANSCVTVDEFIESVKTLMAFTFRKKDTIPETWLCDRNCQLVSALLCPGECNISKNAKQKCPFFIDEGLI